ncbi:hypothetical protein O4H49_17525 [Kiloniella laminariae]|uniref:Uncharacterized protein n=1 Tax=Kiloniella laminariae TaxID=454162 RepID=A0ABT4LN84_9PROT|nr:hypothetical protein [Kiloniella laminariae]MCZ4282593.1 hypothetical protein [Kiloniella laminariae]
MGKQTRLINEFGKVFDDAIVRFHRFGSFSSRYGDEKNALCVEELGWVSAISDQKLMHITLSFDPRFVSDEALSTAGSLLLEAPYIKLGLRYGPDGRFYEEYKEPLLACMRLMSVAALEKGTGRKDRYVAVAKDPFSLSFDASEASARFLPILESWRESSGLFTETATDVMRRQGLLDRAVFIEPDVGYTEPKFTHIGSDIGVYGPDWPHVAVGSRIHQQPDPDYGEWIRKAYEVILHSGLPQYEHVDACMTLDSGSRCRNRYRCLRLPWRTPDGQKLLTGMSIMTPDVEIALSCPEGFSI